MWSKTLTRTIPVPRNTPISDEARWCLAESVWRFAASKGLVVKSFRKVEPRRDVPASEGKKLGAKPEDFDWHVFEAVLIRA